MMMMRLHQLVQVFELRTLLYIQFLQTSQHNETIHCGRHVSYDSLYVGWMSSNGSLAGSLHWDGFALIMWTLFANKHFGALP